MMRSRGFGWRILQGLYIRDWSKSPHPQIAITIDVRCDNVPCQYWGCGEGGVRNGSGDEQ